MCAVDSNCYDVWLLCNKQNGSWRLETTVKGYIERGVLAVLLWLQIQVRIGTLAFWKRSHNDVDRPRRDGDAGVYLLVYQIDTTKRCAVQSFRCFNGAGLMELTVVQARPAHIVSLTDHWPRMSSPLHLSQWGHTVSLLCIHVFCTFSSFSSPRSRKSQP